MSQRRIPLFEREEEHASDDLLPLLKQMESVLQFEHPGGPWHARRKGGTDYGHGATPAAAMVAALRLPLESWRER